jgi:anti-sigma regulatory factor (Ser/Thr protein kinase)
MSADPERAVEALSEVALTDERHRVERILAVARETLGMQIAYFSQFTTRDQVIQQVSGEAAPFGFDAGTQVPRGETFCQRMLNEEMPHAVPDTTSEPALDDLAGSGQHPVGAYIGVPLQLSTGRVYGTLCCASARPNRELGEHDVEFMRVLARLLADTIEHPPPLGAVPVDFDGHVELEDGGQVARLALWLVATPRAAPAARRALDCLGDWVPGGQMGDLQLVTGELVSNSVRHAGLNPSSAVSIEFVVSPGLLRGEVGDPGRGFEPADIPPPTPGEAGGWGLFIVEQLTYRWGVGRSPAGGARVWFELSLA